METLYQILSPHFLLRNSVYASMLVGFACPLVGVFLVMRRLVFMGVALPQISSTGVAVALSLPLWLGFRLADHGSQSAHALAFAGSITFSLTAILGLALHGTDGGADSLKAGWAQPTSWPLPWAFCCYQKTPMARSVGSTC